MMKLVVGLGNPGTKYEWTFHNIGFLVLDHFLSLEPHLKGFSAKGRALVCKRVVRGETIYFMKPQTFMNCSGEAIGPFAKDHGFAPDEVLVVYDEVDLELGRMQFKKGGGAAGHNGLRSIFEHWQKDFYRLRVGVGKPENGDVAEYVLQKRKREGMSAIIEKASSALSHILMEGTEKAMQVVNRRPGNE